MTISQTKTFNIFVGPIQRSSATKILASNYKCENFDYIPNRDLWFNRLYFEISNSKDKIFLTIDCRNFNFSGPSKYRTGGENAREQFCYFNQRKKDKFLNKFLTKRISPKNSDIVFQIASLVDPSKNGKVEKEKKE